MSSSLDVDWCGVPAAQRVVVVIEYCAQWPLFPGLISWIPAYSLYSLRAVPFSTAELRERSGHCG